MKTESSERYSEYLKTAYWKQVTTEVKRRSGYRCQVCNSQHDLQAHHRTYDHRGRELEHLDDLTALCRRCHAIFHGHLEVIPAVQPAPVRIPKREKAHKRTTIVDVEADMPPGEIVTLSAELISRCRANGSFTNATLNAFGLTGKLVSGWVKRLEGKEMSRNDYRMALAGRFVYRERRISQLTSVQPF